ncbi:MAG: thioredoxin family protein [Gammaproteobacteria bacterium]|nr:thioredoxin family protein [Gammaproteobacteria bacterium]MDH5651628.1 thioredoxin family protein [Gammaproteobacteria bacterium]
MHNLKQYIINVHYEDFQEKVLQASAQRTILVDLWADWCPPCLVIGPLLEKVITDYNGEVVLAKLEVDEGENMKIAGRYQVRGFPTVMLFRDGEEKGRFSGAQTAGYIKQFIESHSG